MEFVDLTEEHPARRALGDLAELHDEKIDIVAGSLLIAAEDLGLDEEDLECCIGRLDDISRQVGGLLPDDPEPADRLASLHSVLFGELDLSGDDVDIDDPGSFMLPVVVERRRGLPISLAVMYIAVAERCGLRASGVAFPGHFLARCDIDDGMVLVDPFNGGRTLDVGDCRELLAATSGEEEEFDMSLLQSASPRSVLTTLLAGLRGSYLRRSDDGRALLAHERMVLLNPTSIVLLRGRASLYWRLGRPDRALRDLEKVLSLDPYPDEAAQVSLAIKRLRTEKPWVN